MARISDYSNTSASFFHERLLFEIVANLMTIIEHHTKDYLSLSEMDSLEKEIRKYVNEHTRVRR